MSWRRVVPGLCVCMALAAGCGGDGTSPTTTRGHWEAMGNFNNLVNAMIIYDGDLIVGGAFTDAGGTAANHVARWDGQSWHALGDGVRFESGGYDIGSVRALAVYDGNLIAGGFFNEAGGGTTYDIAQWDGSSWAPLGSGISDDALIHGPYCMAIYAGDLIVGGRFFDAGGVAVHHIARWDGTSWHDVGGGVAGETVTNVADLLVYDGKLVAGGAFTEAGEVDAAYIAQWDGSSWTSFGPGMSDDVVSLLAYDGGLVAGGIFLAAGEVTVNCIAYWDGASWSSLGSGVSGEVAGLTTVYSLTLYDGGLIAGGNFNHAGGTGAACIAEWDGSTWKGLGSGLGGGFLLTAAVAMAEYNNDLIVGGDFTSAGGKTARFIAKWGE